MLRPGAIDNTGLGDIAMKSVVLAEGRRATVGGTGSTMRCFRR